MDLLHHYILKSELFLPLLYNKNIRALVLLKRFFLNIKSYTRNIMKTI